MLLNCVLMLFTSQFHSRWVDGKSPFHSRWVGGWDTLCYVPSPPFYKLAWRKYLPSIGSDGLKVSERIRLLIKSVVVLVVIFKMAVILLHNGSLLELKSWKSF